MAKVVQFNFNTPPEKFGLQPVRKKKSKGNPKPGQLNLFTSGKVVKLNQLSVFDEALLFDEQGDKNSARLRYLKAIEEQDCVADAFCNLGIIEFQAGNFPKAIDCFTKALKEDPRHHEAHYNLANLYAEVGNFTLAKIHYEISIEVDPEFANSYFNLALTLANLKEYNKAVEALNGYKMHSTEDDHTVANDLIFKLSGLSN